MENKTKELDLNQMEKVTGGDNYKIGKVDKPLLDWIGSVIKSIFG